MGGANSLLEVMSGVVEKRACLETLQTSEKVGGSPHIGDGAEDREEG